jgi:hypothetical protein
MHQDWLNEDIAAFFRRFMETGSASSEESVATFA